MTAKKPTRATKATMPAAKGIEKVVNTYFKLIRDLRNGDENSVPRLMKLWDPDGTFEFAGAPPVIGSFRGAVAINTLYKNRLNASGMRLSVETTAAKARDVTLGLVDTEVTHMRTNGSRVAVGWRTTIGTEENIGFDVAGSHLFTFENGKIKTLRVSVSPKPDQSQLEKLRLSDLTVTDVGRLSLAAWPVV
jgi:ketosteroid isomerase-like protein